MYGPGRMGYWGGGRMVRGGPGSPALLIGVLFGAFFLFAVAGPWFNFFPFILLFWMIPFFLVPALGLAARGFGGLLEARAGRTGAEESQGAGASGGARAARGAHAGRRRAGDHAWGLRGGQDALPAGRRTGTSRSGPARGLWATPSGTEIGGS